MHVLVSAHDFYPDPGSGGTGRYVYETARRLADRGHEVSVLTRRRGDVPARETIAGVEVARYDLSVADESGVSIAAQLPGAVRAVRDRLDALPDPDLVSLQATVTDPLVNRLVADEVPRSCIFHSPWSTEYRIRARHGSDISAARRLLNAALRRKIERAVLADCEQVLALSRFMGEKLREVHGSVGDSGHSIPDPGVVPGGVDTEVYRPDAGRYEPMAEGSPAFLTVRRLSPRMGHGLLLAAFARIAPGFPDARLYVAGDGPLREALERRAAELGIDDSVTFLGYVPDEDLPRAYATADCFVLPTRRLEGFGLATLEALASGTPVVATPVGGTTEIAGGLRDDPRVPTDPICSSVDAAALADRMAAWADLAPAVRESAGRACREYVERNYTWDATVDALEARYAKLVPEPSAPSIESGASETLAPR